MHKTRRKLLAVSVAACALSLPQPGEDNTVRMQLLPAGQFRPQDGRKDGIADTGYWFIDAALASQVIARAKGRATQICIDYEHQTLHKEKNGQPAPAAAWIDQGSLEWVEGEGLFGRAVLTSRACELIAGDEYRYFSPVFIFDPATGAVLDLRLGALTNTPAIDGMQPLQAAATSVFAADLAALSQQLNPDSEDHMEELLEQLRWMLNLPVGATADDIKAQLQKLIEQIKTDNPEATAVASFSIATLLGNQAGKIAALSQQINAAGAPDPARYVPLTVMKDLQDQIAALSTQLGTDSVAKVVDDAIAAGRLLTVQAPWARELGRTNMAALNQYLQSAPCIAALTGSQTNGRAPIAEPGNQIDEAVLAVCSMFGNDIDEVQQTMKGGK
jgi:phage I-like protein